MTLMIINVNIFHLLVFIHEEGLSIVAELLDLDQWNFINVVDFEICEKKECLGTEIGIDTEENDLLKIWKQTL